MEAGCSLAGWGSAGTPRGAGLTFRSAAGAPPLASLTASAANERLGQRGSRSGGGTSEPGREGGRVPAGGLAAGRGAEARGAREGLAE